MKKLIIPNLFILALVFSCNSNDDTTDPEISMEGKWNYSKKVLTLTKSDDIIIENGECFENGFLNLEATKYSSEYYMIVENECLKAAETTGTYEVVDNVLIINEIVNDQNVVDKYTIEKFTNNELVISTDQFDFDKDGKNDIETFYFKR